MIKKLVFTLALVFFTGCVSTSDKYRSTTVKNVDIDRFMGKWFVIASIPTWFETTASNAVETYAKNADGSIHVSFSYYDNDPSGEFKEMTQKAYVVDEQTRGHWKIRPIWPLLFDYLVIDLDTENYEYTVIGRPNKANVWIMARSPHISDDLYRKLVRKVVSQGYDELEIKKVQQEWKQERREDQK